MYNGPICRTIAVRVIGQEECRIVAPLRNRTRAPTEDRPSKVEGTQKKREFKRSGMQWS